MPDAKQYQICITEENTCPRLDVCIADNLAGISRSMAQKLIQDGAVIVNGIRREKKYRPVPGDIIHVHQPAAVPMDAVAQEIPLDVVYEDESLLVVNKPKGMVVHPAAGNPDGTLVNALLSHCGDSLSGIGGVLRPGIVHRIDKDTSGLLMVAKDDQAHVRLAEQIREHSFLREYEAVVHGRMKENEIILNYPLGRSAKDRKKMTVTYTHSREAVTHCTLLEQYARHAHVRLRLETGRTHQIRVHLAYIHHPVAGDRVYGPQKLSKAEEELGGQCLHAKRLGFRHPASGEWMEFDSLLPDYFVHYLEYIKKL